MDKIVKQQIMLVEAANATPYGCKVAQCGQHGLQKKTMVVMTTIWEKMVSKWSSFYLKVVFLYLVGTK